MDLFKQTWSASITAWTMVRNEDCKSLQHVHALYEALHLWTEGIWSMQKERFSI